MTRISLPSSPEVARASENDLSVEQRLKLRASANAWISENFPIHRKYLSHSNPQFNSTANAWETTIETKNLNGHSAQVGRLLINADAVIVHAADPDAICVQLDELLSGNQLPLYGIQSHVGPK